MIGRLCRVSLAVCLAVLMAFAPVSPALAQQQQQNSSAPLAQPQPQASDRVIHVSNLDYTHGKRFFPNIFSALYPNARAGTRAA